VRRWLAVEDDGHAYMPSSSRLISTTVDVRAHSPAVTVSLYDDGSLCCWAGQATTPLLRTHASGAIAIAPERFHDARGPPRSFGMLLNSTGTVFQVMMMIPLTGNDFYFVALY
jgi:hypothetical protein